MRGPLVLARFGICLSIAGLLYLTTILGAKSHSWYEPSCCSTKDCAPVADGTVVEKADGVHVTGFGVLSRTDPRIRRSMDDQDHLCIASDRKLLCVYLRPSGV